MCFVLFFSINHTLISFNDYRLLIKTKLLKTLLLKVLLLPLFFSYYFKSINGTGIASSSLSTDPAFWAGYTGTGKHPWDGTNAGEEWSENTRFYVTNAGRLVAKNVYITGDSDAEENSYIIESSNFSVTQHGTLMARDGQIANLSITKNGFSNDNKSNFYGLFFLQSP